MEIEKGLDYVRDNSRAVLATRRRDSSPQMSPVTLAVVDNEIIMSTRETAIKTWNLRRDPISWLCVFPDKWLGRWVQLQCRAEIVSLPDAMDLLVSYYRTLSGEHPDWDDYRRAMTNDQRCIVKFEVEAAGPDIQG
ncbi:MAG: PPOX class F420-dependent oxidoreductase [Acidimicrobiales bacterium]|jgi:PPOX class probable F420-dependent enzyme|nr:PPOX class F420-dependent oxidoreductase [Acidimicrobiales bacterium]MDP6901771.1 PPOX class F420-dependent oxidoreductase [Acidimicrobiales bacterium]HJL98188.1 PPOX class F420-dependent oxidoreductase [Acidimicrobiales bacterium]